MAGKDLLTKAVGVGIGLLILFLLFSTLIMPQFSTAWRYCQGREWVGATGGTLTNCTTPYQNSNTSYVNPAGATHTESGQTDPVVTDNDAADQFCLNCATVGGYRATNQGLTLLILVMGLIGFALRFFPRR